MYKLILFVSVCCLFPHSGSAQEELQRTWCLRFAVVEKSDSGSENWGIWPQDAIQWWQKDGKKKFSELCDSTLENAEFVLTWDKKSYYQEVCEPNFPEPTYPDSSRPDYWPPPSPDPPQQNYPNYEPPTYPDYSPPPYSPPSPTPPGTGMDGDAGTVCLACRISLTQTDHPRQDIIYGNYVVSYPSSPECHGVWKERVSVNVYRAETLAGKFGPFKPFAKKEGHGGNPGKGAFQSAMETLRKEVKKAATTKTRP